MNRQIGILIAILLLVGGSTMFALAYRNSVNTSFGESSEPDPDAELPEQWTEFTLVDQNAKPFSSKELDGKVWIGNFFFSLCTTECPAQNRKIAILMTDFAEQGLECVSITCDPSRDTPSTLLDYSKQFNANPDRWHFLTKKDFEYIQDVANRFFRLPLKRFTHSDQVVLFNRKGDVHGVYSVMKPAAFLELHEAIKTVLSEPKTETGHEDTGHKNNRAADLSDKQVAGAEDAQSV